MRQHSVNLLVIVLQLFEGIPLWVGWGWRVINSDEEKFYACLSARSGLFPLFSFEELNSIGWSWVISTTHNSSKWMGIKLLAGWRGPWRLEKDWKAEEGGVCSLGLTAGTETLIFPVLGWGLHQQAPQFLEPLAFLGLQNAAGKL